jgi:hypothetical protein
MAARNKLCDAIETGELVCSRHTEHSRGAPVSELIDIVLNALMTVRFAHEVRAHLGRNGLVSAAAYAVSEDRASKFTIMPSPMESNVPSDPHMQTLAATIKLQNELD